MHEALTFDQFDNLIPPAGIIDDVAVDTGILDAVGDLGDR